MIRWYENHANLPLGEISIPHLVECSGSETDTPSLEVVDRTIPILWPWDMIHWRDNIDKLGDWIADKPEKAFLKCLEAGLKLVLICMVFFGELGDGGMLTLSYVGPAFAGALQDYWRHVQDEPFTADLDLSQPSRTIPLVFHVDGVKVFKNQKVWVYSYSSMVRKKGNSLENKMVLAIIRDSMLAKPHTHDAMANVIAWVCATLSTGRFPLCDWKGAPWATSSIASRMAGQPFTRDGWRCEFAAFKGDLEARVMIHKMIRNYMANMICEHCPAGKLLNFADFRKNAPWALVRFSHQELLDLNPAHRQSQWTKVRGWRKERNLEALCCESNFL